MDASIKRARPIDACTIYKASISFFSSLASAIPIISEAIRYNLIICF
jgi:hypothetical protein